MNSPRPAQHLLRQAAGAVAWGAFFILAPMELLFVGALVWIPLLVWRERRRARFYGFLPGAGLRLGIVVAIVMVAVHLPVKREDVPLGELSQRTVTLGELAEAGMISPPDVKLEPVRVLLPSTTPTKREIMRAIAEQTGLRANVSRCATGASILSGPSVGSIHVSPRPAVAQR